MRFYVDFEATQPENEIIAIGAVCENGSTFYELVKPQLSSISKFVSELTGITVEDLNEAKTIDEVLVSFDEWVMAQEPNLMECHFFSYGDDYKYIKYTAPAIKTLRSLYVAGYLSIKIEDATKSIFKFFHGTISLINAFNYINSLQNEQCHNPLEDAIMLQKVIEATETMAPPEVHPSKPKTNMSYNPPSGVFYCKKKGMSEKEFSDCEEAITWYINNNIDEASQPMVHRGRIMSHIMKAVKSDGSYGGYKWRRVKNKNKKKEGE